MPSYNLSNASPQINSAISGSYTALFGGGFAGNLKINGTVSGNDGSFTSVTSSDGFFTNTETSDLSVSSVLSVDAVGTYRKPQHFNSGILIGRNAAPNFLTPTLVQSGVSDFRYPVLIGGWNASPVLSVSGDASITGSVIARNFTVTGQILPLNEAVSGRIPIFQSNTGTFSQALITGGRSSMLGDGYDLTVEGDSYFKGGVSLFDGEIIAPQITVNTAFAAPQGDVTTLTSNQITANYITGHSGSFPLSFIVATGGAPATSTSAGTLGQIVLKNSKLHVCTGTNQWGSISIGAFAL